MSSSPPHDRRRHDMVLNERPLARQDADADERAPADEQQQARDTVELVLALAREHRFWVDEAMVRACTTARDAPLRHSLVGSLAPAQRASGFVMFDTSAEHGSEPLVAFAVCCESRCSASGHRWMEVAHAFVHPAYRRRGIGHRLVAWCAEQAARIGVPALNVNCKPHKDSLDFWWHEGFRGDEGRAWTMLKFL